MLLLSDISLHAHSSSQEAKRQGNHSIGCVIRIINQSIVPVNLSHQIIQQLKYGGSDMGFWDRLFGYKENLFRGREALAQILTINFPVLHFCQVSYVADSFAFHYTFHNHLHWDIKTSEGNGTLLSIAL